MQPFRHPVARAVLGSHGRLGLELAARLDKGIGRPGALMQRPAACLRCHVRAIDAPARFYSSQSPSQDTSTEKPRNETQPDDPTHSNEPAQPTAPHELPSTKENRRSQVNQRFSHIMDTVQLRVVNASQTLNDMTGYSDIETIKTQNKALETSLAAAHDRVRAVRQAYKSSNTKRANTQREVTTLLARKDSWSPTDLERFTELYRTDHVLEGEVAGTQEALTEAEAEEQSLSQRLNAGMLKRYHEEQIWSDRIRRASTWGTWGLMGMNFILFVVLQFVAEPWRRRRLVRGVVEEEKGVLEEVRGELAAVKAGLQRAAEAGKTESPPELLPPHPTLGADEPPADVANGESSWTEFLLDPSRWKPAAADLYSERRVDLRMRDASALALQGAVTGAAVAGGMVLLLVRRS